MLIDSYSIFIIICLIICILLFFVHQSNTFNVLRQTTYALDCNGFPIDIEFYSLRNRIYRYDLFNKNYKEVLFIVSIIILIIIFIIRIFLLWLSKDKDIIVFSFIFIFMIFHIIIYNHDVNKNTYNTYKQDIEELRDRYKYWLDDYSRVNKSVDVDKRYKKNSTIFKRMLKDNIDTVMRGTINTENLHETFIKNYNKDLNKDFINFIDFSDPRVNVSIININPNTKSKDRGDVRVELYKNTYKIIDKKGNYHYEMLRDIYSFHYGPEIYKGIYLNVFNWLFTFISITIVILYIYNIIFV